MQERNKAMQLLINKLYETIKFFRNHHPTDIDRDKTEKNKITKILADIEESGGVCIIGYSIREINLGKDQTDRLYIGERGEWQIQFLTPAMNILVFVPICKIRYL